uniref:Uncharacterized protein n=1 Tax=Panagrolaimus superbus TaxID=310955 RepID=A0A914Z8V8_9BILA
MRDGEVKPNFNKFTKELSMLDKNMQASLKETKQILLDHHFQTHIELPTFALFRHVTTYISNPTLISENELFEACSKRYSPNDILSNLSLLLQKQWILNKFKDSDYDKDTVDGVEQFIENLIKQMIISQSFCIEMRYGDSGENKSYRLTTLKFVEEIRSMLLKQVKTLKKSLNTQIPQPCAHKKQKKNSKTKSSSSLMMALKSPYYLVKFLFNIPCLN